LQHYINLADVPRDEEEKYNELAPHGTTDHVSGLFFRPADQLH
jgi:hypothetical protein